MANLINHIFSSLDKNEKDIRKLSRMVVRSRTAMGMSFLCMGLAVILMKCDIDYNTKKIEELEKEIKELKGE